MIYGQHKGDSNKAIVTYEKACECTNATATTGMFRMSEQDRASESIIA